MSRSHFYTTAYRQWFFIPTVLVLAIGIASCSAIGRVSVSSLGVVGNFASTVSCPSNDGRYIAFQSNSSNLVPDDVGSFTDIFVRDTLDGVTTRVSVDSTGKAGNRNSIDCAISEDGRYVAFSSLATNLVLNDTNGALDVFLHDRDTSTTSRVSLTNPGSQANNISRSPAMSADARYIAFYSIADDLVVGDTLARGDIFVRDRIANTTTRVSVDSNGVEARDFSSEPSISADGRYVTFTSRATNLVAGDTNNKDDIFVHDRNMSTTIRASVDSSGIQGNFSSGHPSLSAAGDAVAFWSTSNNLVAGDTNGKVDIFVRELNSGATTRVSLSSAGIQGTDHAAEPAISSSARYVAFQSAANNMIPVDSNGVVDVFIHDRETGATTRESLQASGAEAVGSLPSLLPAYSADERYISFSSSAPLAGGPINFFGDIYLRAVPPSSVNSVAPSNIAIGATTVVTISGANFLLGASPSIGDYVTSFTLVDENTITATVTVPAGSEPGSVDALVFRPGTGPGGSLGVVGLCQNCVTLF